MPKEEGRLLIWWWRGIYLMWPLTYAILIVDDITHYASLRVSILRIFTLDAILALMWPATWVYWIVQAVLQQPTALSRLLGF